MTNYDTERSGEPGTETRPGFAMATPRQDDDENFSGQHGLKPILQFYFKVDGRFVLGDCCEWTRIKKYGVGG